MRSSGLRCLGILLGLALAAPFGCQEDGRECYPTDWRACLCGDGARGYQQCDAEGAAYGTCDCSGKIPGLSTSAGAGGSGGGGGGEKLPFLAACMTDDQCETGICHLFPSKGAHCTQACSPAAPCPPESPGCNPMGVCKLP